MPPGIALLLLSGTLRPLTHPSYAERAHVLCDMMKATVSSWLRRWIWKLCGCCMVDSHLDHLTTTSVVRQQNREPPNTSQRASIDDFSQKVGNAAKNMSNLSVQPMPVPSRILH